MQTVVYHMFLYFKKKGVNVTTSCGGWNTLLWFPKLQEMGCSCFFTKIWNCYKNALLMATCSFMRSLSSITQCLAVHNVAISIMLV